MSDSNRERNAVASGTVRYHGRYCGHKNVGLQTTSLRCDFLVRTVDTCDAACFRWNREVELERSPESGENMGKRIRCDPCLRED